MRTKIISSPLLFITILVFSLFVVTTKPLSAQTLLDTGASSAIGNTIDSGPAINPNTIRERVRQNIEQRTENIRENQEIRNKIIEICKNTDWKNDVAPKNTSSKKIQTWRIYKYLKEQIPELK